MVCWNGFLTVFDTLICLFVVFPLSVLHWRGTWQLQDVYFTPDNHVNSAWISLTIGANVCLIELLLQPSLAALIVPRGGWVYTTVSRLHLYIHGWAVMCFWRGVWNLLDHYMGTDWLNAVVTYVICQTIMLLARTVRTTVGVPMALQVDTDPDLLQPDTVFKTPPSQMIHFILDCCFTQFIIVPSSICIWRAIWNILDAFVFPHLHEWSDLVSLTSGLFGISLFFLIQYPTSYISRRLDKCPRTKLVYEDAMFLILTWLNLLLWRGGWNLCENHFLPDPFIGGWVSHCIGTVGLLSIQVFNNVGLHGIVRDGSYSNGEGFYPTQYLRILLESDVKESVESKESLESAKPLGTKSCDPLVSRDWFNLDGDVSEDEQSDTEETTVLLRVEDNGNSVIKDTSSSLQQFSISTTDDLS